MTSSPLFSFIVPAGDFTPQTVLKRFQSRLQRFQSSVDYWFAEKGKELPDWPSLYFAPMIAWSSLLQHESEFIQEKDPYKRQTWIAQELAFISMLGPWRYTQGIFRFDKTFLRELSQTTLKEDIPCDVLLRLPQWSIYVEMPDMPFEGAVMKGFWASLHESPTNNTETELHLLINVALDDTHQRLIPFHLDLQGGSILDIVSRLYDRLMDKPLSQQELDAYGDDIKSVYKRYKQTDVRQNENQRLSSALTPIFATLLYLCSNEPDIQSLRIPGIHPTNAVPKRIKKKGLRLLPPAGPHIWLVGQTMEKVISASNVDQEKENDEKERFNQKHRGVRSHIRSAHWHGFWKGPKPKEGQQDTRTFIYHWLPPMIVRGSKDSNTK